jgi:hypothetical protein
VKQVKETKNLLKEGINGVKKKKKMLFCSEFAKILYEEQIKTCKTLIK